MKVAIFAMWGGPVENKMAPEGCPVEYVRPENRHELAEWLVMNANNKGPFIIEKWQEGFTTYEYLFQYGKNDFPLEFLARIVVVDVDQSRPWLIHNYDGWEEIWYIDVKANRNQVIPEVFKAKVRDYANREKEERINMLHLKAMGVTSVSILLSATGKVPEGYFATGYFPAKSVSEAWKTLRRCSDWGMEVDALNMNNELGENVRDGHELLEWIEKESLDDPDFKLPKKIIAHSSDYAVREKMERIIERLYSQKTI